MIDFHNHLIPGVDDGAEDDEQALDGLRAFLEHDVRQIIATPHIDGSLSLRPQALEKRMREIDNGWRRLESIAREHLPEIELHRGAEIMLDTPDPKLDDARLRLAGTKFVLCEYPFMTVPPNSAGVLHAIRADGYIPVIAHPERYVGVGPSSALPSRWREAGALLQVNAGSITGRYGTQPKLNSFALLENGMIDFICSDYHSRGRPWTSAARETLIAVGGSEQADLLMQINPRRLLEGEPPLPVPALRLKVGMRDRLRRWLG
jgi:protein-tyrosine phosphatase